MNKRIVLLYIFISAILIAMLLLNLCVGSSGIRPEEAWRCLLTHDTESVQGTVIFSIRMPRVVAAAVLGGALALSGYLLQVFFANPIAGPYVLGISSGAKLTVALLMVGALRFGYALSSGMMVAAAFVGSVASLV